jgi:quercetin dioxygenase-like cupin family protein
MREYVPFLDTKKMEWAPGDMPGLFTKMLSRDESTGARTALQRIDPSYGYKEPEKPHYHSGDEEIFLIKGRFTFDGRQWLKRFSYCFHPARTVHGFHSKLPEESWFLSRIRQDLDFSFSDEYRDEKPFNLDGQEPVRGISIHPDPLQEEWQEVKDENGNVILRKLILSQHPDTHEGSMLIEFLPGWKNDKGTHMHSVYKEFFVMEGSLTNDEGVVFDEGCYAFIPPNTPIKPMSSSRGAICYVNVGGELDYQKVS